MPMIVGAGGKGRDDLAPWHGAELPAAKRLADAETQTRDHGVGQQEDHAEPDQVAGVDERRVPVGPGQVVVDVLSLDDVAAAGDDGDDRAHAGDGSGPRDQQAERDHAGDDEGRRRGGDEPGDATGHHADEQGAGGSAASRGRRCSLGGGAPGKARTAASNGTAGRSGGSGPAGPRRRRGRWPRTQRRARRGSNPRTRQRSRVAPETASAAQTAVLGGVQVSSTVKLEPPRGRGGRPR